MNDQPAWKYVLNKTRQRLAGLVGRGVVGAERSPPDASTGFQELPPEIMEKVVKNLATADLDDLRATARNLNNFRQASRGTREFVDSTPSVGRFSATLNQAGQLAKDLQERTYPRNGLPEVGPDLGMHEELGLPVPAANLVAAVGSVRKLQPARVKSKLIRDVKAISNSDARAEARAAMAMNIGDLDPKDQSSLINGAIADFGAKGELHSFQRHMAAEAIALARNHLQPKDVSKLAETVRRRPELNDLINTRIDRLERRAETARATRNNEAASEDGQPKPVMNELLVRFEDASRNTTIGEHQRVEAMQAIAGATARVVNEAREKLMKSERSRTCRER